MNKPKTIETISCACCGCEIQATTLDTDLCMLLQSENKRLKSRIALLEDIIAEAGQENESGCHEIIDKFVKRYTFTDYR